MEKFESRNVVNEMFDAFQSLHADPFHPDSKQVEKITNSIHDSLMTSESTKELHDLSQEYVHLFQEWDTKVREDDTNGLFEQGVNEPFYSDDQYMAFHNFNSAIPEMIIKCSAVRAYELIREQGIPTSLHSLLNLLEDFINTRHLSLGTVDENREMINRAMMIDKKNIHDTFTLDTDLSGEEVDAIAKLQEELLTFDIVYDSMQISSRELSNFRLLFDSVGYIRFQSNILNKRTMDIK
jgi:hypothetical protein